VLFNFSRVKSTVGQTVFVIFRNCAVLEDKLADRKDAEEFLDIPLTHGLCTHSLQMCKDSKIQKSCVNELGCAIARLFLQVYKFIAIILATTATFLSIDHLLL